MNKKTKNENLMKNSNQSQSKQTQIINELKNNTQLEIYELFRLKLSKRLTYVLKKQSEYIKEQTKIIDDIINSNEITYETKKRFKFIIKKIKDFDKEIKELPQRVIYESKIIEQYKQKQLK